VAKALGYQVAQLGTAADIGSTIEALGADGPNLVCFASTAATTTEAMSALRAAVARSLEVSLASSSTSE
jgi:hypothetical protein